MEFYHVEDLERLDEKRWRALALAQLQAKQKPLTKVWGLAEALLEIDPDIAMLVEVGGQESLENFSRHFLADRYTPYFVEGNSRRSIDLGFLVKKELPFQIEARSNRDTPVEVYTLQGKHETRFSRDIAELRLHDSDGLRLILLLVHLKSKISSDTDYQGKDVRTAEAIALAEFYKKRRTEFPEVPLILGGDCNATLGSLELELISRTDLVDFHEVLGSPAEERATYVYFDALGRAVPQALDYLLLSPELRDRIVKEESYTYRYKGLHAEPGPMSQSARNRQPSDHNPVVVTVRL